MKKVIKMLVAIIALPVLLSSCYSYTTVVGKGAQGTAATSKWNNYVVGGLVPVGVSDPKAMAGGAQDYTVFTRHSFVNLLVSGVTFGIFTPTTTTVTK